ncbi:MAG: radical SAM protein [Clostridia bacterium]|nr:radical SAM protein [Clostridia bacterium]
MMKCDDCPRGCEVKATFCGKDFEKIRVGKAMKFFSEEPIICPENKGCGAVFFSFCSLKCVYCQNFVLSKEGFGRDLSEDELVALFKRIDASDVENIDLVTPTHYTSKILSALKKANVKKSVIWNSSGYEKVENIEKMKDLVDIFLFDVKYYDNGLALKYSKVNSYFEVCKKAIKKAREIVKDNISGGIMKSGIILRHLILPGHIDDSKRIFDEIKKEFGTDIYISVMSQFTPIDCCLCDENLKRKLKRIEYKSVCLYIKSLGFKNGFFQEMSSATDKYLPSFDGDIFF